MKSERTLRLGVVGCGQMGRKHAVNCSRIEGVSVVAVADKDHERASAVAKDIRAVQYESAEAMVANAGLDAVVIATPPGQRRQAVEAAVGAGDAVFVEKPIALDLAAAKSFCSAAQEASVVNAVGFHLRYSPLTQRALALLSGKRITHVRTLTTTSYYLKMDMPAWFLQRKHSGGPLLEQTLHMFDIARYLVGEITHVFGRGDRLVRPDLGNFDSEDTIVLAYRFANGALGTNTDSCAMLQFNWEIELLGPYLRLLVDYSRRRLDGYVGEEKVHVDVPDIDLHMLEMQAFINAVRDRREALVLSNFADATKTLEVMLAGDRSLRTSAWEPVGRDEIGWSSRLANKIRL